MTETTHCGKWRHDQNHNHMYIIIQLYIYVHVISDLNQEILAELGSWVTLTSCYNLAEVIPPASSSKLVLDISHPKGKPNMLSTQVPLLHVF